MEEIVATVTTLAALWSGVLWYARPSKGRYPKCLVCSWRLVPSDGKITECGRCKVRYHTATVVEASIPAWEKVRKERLFALSFRRDVREQHLLLEAPLSELKGANESTVDNA